MTLSEFYKNAYYKNKYGMILNEECLSIMKQMEDECIDLTITSPPYDNLRNYNGFSFDFENIAKQLFRITKKGGVVVWNVSDATIKGSETGTSFKQALYFKDCGFNLHDTMIWIKDGGGAVGSKYCYTQNFEYMFIFSKGKPKTVNLIYDKQNGSYGLGTRTTHGRRNKEGILKTETRNPPKEFSKRNNWWYIPPIKSKDYTNYPAVFPEELANDHIISWSNEKDIIFDPFMGSGTTAKMAMLNNRRFIGCEISKEYCDIIKERLEKYKKINEK